MSRALCQPSRETQGPAEREAPECQLLQTLAERDACKQARQALAVASSDRYVYCYDDLEGDGLNDYLYSWPAIVKGGAIVRDAGPCSAGYFCAAPGRRYGHASDTVLIQGEATMLLVLGGEAAHWVKAPALCCPTPPLF